MLEFLAFLWTLIFIIGVVVVIPAAIAIVFSRHTSEYVVLEITTDEDGEEDRAD